MIITILIMLAAALLIYFSCELFVNAIEWVGKAFNISQNAVGTVLAAFGTALPESVVTLIAVAFGTNASQKDVGIGAALGGPLVLSTLAYAVVGISIIIFRNNRKLGSHLNIDGRKLGHDQLWFLFIFVFKVGLGFVAFAIKPYLGILFFIAYGFYFFTEMNGESKEIDEKLEPLKFASKSLNPKKSIILFQTLFSLTLIFVGSQLFVHNLNNFSTALGIPAHIVALFLSPVATELPEILNAIIWVRQGKENLALANISGSMMIQATVPSGLGIMFTSWIFDKSLAFSAIITFIAILFLYMTLRKHHLSVKRLSFVAMFYVAFVIGMIFII
ncbi:sodium:calcium antiporter [Clostridium saccharobutylicum]|uniref:Sodium/calcium exchanger membrane region n=1 Tax=Clostridium saccharobutylicum DSM 13864 TaxID=1345695 RepID=U5MS87_CLOSA|nr:sodium:calcium antiporter [Clostridium saccharobutylicum]AGX43450.1 sodium/calcium exchanger membrane region [Clostridium saccharobutylicum DSM 13864]AQR90748.1 putative calcium/sodium:proton antiporter [Clostridium saccharobutylicum]AQS00652.1 putative calcium/sodium:proton antiporter [Clostridium saccharobutylicum]AQS10310.1 putative calcium/sodium:proton antiporter [Clostridium saccharobutylicum]AQS14635.1 putative calcium/sodium:proton antiporter [Clostridium saccharobutylicum]